MDAGSSFLNGFHGLRPKTWVPVPRVVPRLLAMLSKRVPVRVTQSGFMFNMRSANARGLQQDQAPTAASLLLGSGC